MLDPCVAVNSAQLEALNRKRLQRQRFDRDQLFRRMALGRPALVSGLQLPTSGKSPVPAGGFPEAIVDALGRGAKARVQMGRSKRRAELPISEVFRRWQGARAIIGVTDLHFRGTRLEQLIDTHPLSDFNVLVDCPHPAHLMEMMTLVISTTGNVTESHTDDCDGSNHCFVGAKLWLAWDRISGQGVGLEDVTHDDVRGSAHFDMEAFLSLPSSRWWVVRPGDTLFLPGDLTHRVITLEPYLGLGSFYVSLPNYLRTLFRWTYHGAADVSPRMLAQIHEVVIARVKGLSSASDGAKRRWGLEHAKTSVGPFRALLRASNMEAAENRWIDEYLEVLTRSS